MVSSEVGIAERKAGDEHVNEKVVMLEGIINREKSALRGR